MNTTRDLAPWTSWLDTLEDALGHYASRLAAGAAATFTVVLPPQDEGDLPPELTERVLAVQDAVEAATRRTQGRQSLVAQQLAAVPHVRRRAAGPSTQDLGSAFDVSG